MTSQHVSLQMVPLLQKSCNILVEKLGELAGTEKSVDIFKYTF